MASLADRGAIPKQRVSVGENGSTNDLDDVKLKDRLRELLCIHGLLAEGHRIGHWSRNRTDTSWASAKRAD